MNYIDSLEVIVPMTKLADSLPYLEGMKKVEIREALQLSVDVEELRNLGFTHYRVIQGGVDSNTLKISDGKISGYPTLKVRIYAIALVEGNVFDDDRARIGSCFSYRLVTSDSECCYEDCNGYTSIRRVSAEIKSAAWFAEKIEPRCIPTCRDL